MIKLFGSSLDYNQMLVVEKIKNFMGEECEVIDLSSFEPEINEDDVVIVFGRKAQRRTENMKSRFRIELPAPFQLDATLGASEETREETFRKLQELKQALDSGANKDIPNTTSCPKTNKTLNLTEELPPQLTTIAVQELEKQQRAQGLIHWSGRTVDGRTIRVTVEPEENSADINLTFAELYAVIGLKEAFRVKELEIVHKPSTTTRESSTD